MPIIRDMPITITLDEILFRQTKGKPTEAVQTMAEWAIERAGELIDPVVIYRVLKSTGIDGEELVLEGDTRLKLGPHADLIEPAEQVIITATTIGPRLEEEARRLMAGPDVMKGYMLDCAGVVAVGQASLAVRDVIEEMARAKGWGVGPSLYPGSPMGWPMQGQRDLLALLNIDEIGISLTKSCLMVPGKSGSGLVGIGPGYTDEKVGTLCHWCSLKDRCWRRKERVRTSI